MVRNSYQIDTYISDRGIIELSDMPYLYNRKVKLFIVLPEENVRENGENEQRRQAMKRLLKRHEAIPASHWTDEELDSLRYKHLKEKQQ